MLEVGRQTTLDRWRRGLEATSPPGSQNNPRIMLGCLGIFGT
jgi:hypothetical protein